MQATKELPACPVETTLMLIGDKWKVLILRDLMPGTKRFGELKKFHWQRVAEGADCTVARYGGKRPGTPGGLRRGAAAGRVQPDGAGKEPEADPGCVVNMGRRI